MGSEPLINELLSQVWFHFVLVALFGFLTGLEFSEYSKTRGKVYCALLILLTSLIMNISENAVCPQFCERQRPDV